MVPTSTRRHPGASCAQNHKDGNDPRRFSNAMWAAARWTWAGRDPEAPAACRDAMAIAAAPYVYS